MKQKTKFLRKKFLNSQRGITLIALVVTIIVLLILAGVALSLISGSDGILNQATTSADQTDIATIQEDVELALGTMKSQYYEARYVNGENIGTSFPEYARAQMTDGYETAKGAILTIDAGTTVTYTKNNGETLTGTFDEDTGAVIMAGTVSAGTPVVPATYTVTYDTHGGNETVADETDVSKGTSITLPTVTKTNYVFAGWYTAETGGTKVGDAGASYTVKSNVTLHAQWVGYTVTYNTHGAKETVTNETNVAGGSQVILPTVTKDKYRFSGWYDAESNGNKVGDAGDSYTVTGNATLHAQWSDSVGEEVTYGGEQFFVIGHEEGKVKLFAKYCLNEAGTAQCDKNASWSDYDRVFSSTNYWNGKSGVSYPCDLQTSERLGWIPSSDTVENNAILAAQSYGTSKNATGRLMTLDEANAIMSGSDSSLKNILTGRWSGEDAPVDGFMATWLGTAYSTSALYLVGDAAIYGVRTYDYSTISIGVRPILEVPET